LPAAWRCEERGAAVAPQVLAQVLGPGHQVQVAIGAHEDGRREPRDDHLHLAGSAVRAVVRERHQRSRPVAPDRGRPRIDRADGADHAQIGGTLVTAGVRLHAAEEGPDVPPHVELDFARDARPGFLRVDDNLDVQPRGGLGRRGIGVIGLSHRMGRDQAEGHQHQRGYFRFSIFDFRLEGDGC